MAACREQLTPMQNRIFHENYEYMWKKLSATYYQVSQTPEKCRSIQGREYLPSYAYLCRCMKAEYVPTLSTVNKIVDFYNANIAPKVSSYQFISELLSAQDAMRCRMDGCRCSDKLAGTYYGYYMDSDENGGIAASILQIYARSEAGEAESRIRYIAGIHDPELLQDERLLAIARKREFDKKAFDHWCGAVAEKGHPLVRVYEGEAQISSGSVFMMLQDIANTADRLCIAIDISLFMNADEREKAAAGQIDGKYIGGMAMGMRVSEEAMCAFLIGLARIDLKEVPDMILNAKEIIRFLRIRAEDSKVGRLQMNTAQDQKWYLYLKSLAQRARRAGR